MHGFAAGFFKHLVQSFMRGHGIEHLEKRLDPSLDGFLRINRLQ